MESLVAQRIKSVLEAKQISISAFSKMIGMQQVTCNRQLRGDQACITWSYRRVSE